MKDKNERYFKVGKVSIDLDNFFKTDWDQVKVNALIDLFLPTKRVETTPGKITTSLRGIKGRSYLIVAI